MQVIDKNGRLKVEITSTVDDLSVGITTISGGTNGRVLYDNAGILGELDLTSIYVPTSRTLTINGTTQDLSADRTFTISTGITIGTTAITSGTVGRVLFEGTGNVVSESAGLTYNDTTKAFQISGNQNASTSITISNTTSGASAQSALLFNGTAGIYKYSASTTPYKIFASNDFGHYNGVIGDLAILNDVANGKIKFATNQSNTPQMTLAATGNLLINTTTDAGFKLDVNGTARVQGSLTIPSTANFGVSITRSGTLGIAQQVYNNGGTTYLGADNSSGGFLFTSGLPYASFFGNGSNYPTQFGTNGAVRMTIFAGGNVGINTTTDVASSKLTIESTTQGFLPPRQTQAQRTAIASPAIGLQVYQTDGVEGLYIYKSTGWALLL